MPSENCRAGEVRSAESDVPREMTDAELVSHYFITTYYYLLKEEGRGEGSGDTQFDNKLCPLAPPWGHLGAVLTPLEAILEPF